MSIDCDMPEHVLQITGKSLNDIRFGDGKAGASSFLDTDPPANVFIYNYQKRWYSKKDQLPAYIWYEFEKGHVPAKISFLSAYLQSALRWMPSEFQFIGTNDLHCRVESKWEVLCDGRFLEQIA